MSRNGLMKVPDDLGRTTALDFSAGRSAPPPIYYHPEILPFDAHKIFKQLLEQGQ